VTPEESELLPPIPKSATIAEIERRSSNKSSGWSDQNLMSRTKLEKVATGKKSSKVLPSVVIKKKRPADKKPFEPDSSLEMHTHLGTS